MFRAGSSCASGKVGEQGHRLDHPGVTLLEIGADQDVVECPGTGKAEFLGYLGDLNQLVDRNPGMTIGERDVNIQRIVQGPCLARHAEDFNRAWLREQKLMLALCLSRHYPVRTGWHLRPPPPRPGSWSEAASLATGREEHTATLLASGKVLIAGGTDGRGSALASAELYDPRSNRWTPAGPMSTSRLGHSATLLATARFSSPGV